MLKTFTCAYAWLVRSAGLAQRVCMGMYISACMCLCPRPLNAHGTHDCVCRRELVTHTGHIVCMCDACKMVRGALHEQGTGENWSEAFACVCMDVYEFLCVPHRPTLLISSKALSFHLPHTHTHTPYQALHERQD